MSPPGRPKGEFRSAQHEGTPVSAAAVHSQAALMLRAPWQWRRNSGPLWTFWLYAALVALLAGVSSLAVMIWAPAAFAKVLFGMFGAIGLLAVWGQQFSALLRLDHPHLARFVVGHGRALRAAALGLWVTLVALVVLVAALTLDQPGDGYRLLLVVAMVAGAALLYVAMALRWWWLWVAVWLLFPVGGHPRVKVAVHPFAVWFRELWHAQPVLVTLILLLAMATALVSLFGRADAHHARAYARHENFRKIVSAGFTGQKPTLAAYGRWGELLGMPFQRLVDAWLGHVTRRASPHRRSVLARAAVVLYGAQHWVRLLGITLMVQLVLVIGLDVYMRWVGYDLHQQFWNTQLGLSMGLASMAVAPVVSLRGSLWGSRREQALLMLLPGMPQGVLLNRALARQQMQVFLMVWTAALPALGVMAWWGNAPQVCAFTGAVLPLAALLWRDAARLGQPSPAMALVPYLLFMAVGLTSILMLRWQPEWLVPWALGMVTLTAALLAWRWHRLSRWPQALPAGRLA